MEIDSKQMFEEISKKAEELGRLKERERIMEDLLKIDLPVFFFSFFCFVSREH